MILDNNYMVFRIVKQIYTSTRSIKAFIDTSLPNIIRILIFMSEKHFFSQSFRLYCDLIYDIID